jgi:RNA polymerase sigma-70 factor (ECF subfamily)
MVTDLELLERWRAGQRDAGNQLFERHFDSVCRFFEHKVQGDVEELVQATFLACIDNRDKFRQKSSFRTYLFAIARYQLYGYYRSKKRDGAALDFGVTSLVDLGTGAHSRIAKDQDQQLLLTALCSLPLDQQLLLELFYWENMEGAELADVFDVAPATVRTRLFRARSALRDRMAELAKDSARSLDLSVENLDQWARRLRDRRS